VFRLVFSSHESISRGHAPHGTLEKRSLPVRSTREIFQILEGPGRLQMWLKEFVDLQPDFPRALDVNPVKAMPTGGIFEDFILELFSLCLEGLDQVLNLEDMDIVLDRARAAAEAYRWTPAWKRAARCTRAARAGSVSPRWAAATTSTPWRRAAWANSSGNWPLPAIKPMLSDICR